MNLVAYAIAVILIVSIFGALLPSIADSTIGINVSDSNITGANYVLASLIVLILTIVVLIGFVKMAGISIGT